MLKKNDEIILNIDSMSAEGMGVGRREGLVIFVPQTAPGDSAKVHITKVLKDRAYGKILEIINPSPDRTERDCDASARCGGCTYRHITYESELRIKRNKISETLKRLANTNTAPEHVIPSPKVSRYRNKAMLPFGINAEGRISTGFYASGSHRLVKISDCDLTPGIFTEISETAAAFANERQLSVYNEETGKGLLRRLYLRCGEHSGEVMVCVVTNGGGIPGESELVKTLTNKFPQIKSILLNINRKKANTVLGESYRLLYGGGYITDNFCGLNVIISPESFYQVNSPAAELLYNKALTMANPEPGTRVLDLFCGIGTIGLFFAKSCPGIEVTGIDSVARAINDANKNAKLNNISNISFHKADINEPSTLGELKNAAADIIIADPPRKGLGYYVTAAISAMSPEKVLYISCEPATLARDINYFNSFGYSVENITSVDLFPRTWHVECAALLSRSGD